MEHVEHVYKHDMPIKSEYTYLTARPILVWFVKARSLLVRANVLASNVVMQSAYTTGVMLMKTQHRMFSQDHIPDIHTKMSC